MIYTPGNTPRFLITDRKIVVGRKEARQIRNDGMTTIARYQELVDFNCFAPFVRAECARYLVTRKSK